jgi:D-alanyl-D-alanine carboxypeptidase
MLSTLKLSPASDNKEIPRLPDGSIDYSVYGLDDPQAVYTVKGVLFEKNADSRSLIASTTKIMTALVVCEQCNVLDRVRIPKEAVGIEGSSMYLQEGEVLTLQELLYGLMLRSGNDAAVALAIYCGGTVEGFAQLMNDKAHRLGMENTHFVNPNGLDAPGHYSTAKDMAILAAYAMENPIFRQTVSTKSVTTGNRVLQNHNKLLWRVEGADGVKTGFTKAAGRCLVSAVEKNGIVLVAVTLNAYDDWNDHIKLYNYCFPLLSVKKTEDLLNNVVPHVVNSTTYSVNISLSEEVLIPYKATVPKYTYNVYMPRFLYAPMKKGDYIGWVDVYTPNDVLIKRVYIVCTEDIQVKQVSEETFLKKLIKFIVKDRR